jgi:predicted DNA-binding WGR domain protein
MSARLKNAPRSHWHASAESGGFGNDSAPRRDTGIYSTSYVQILEIGMRSEVKGESRNWIVLERRRPERNEHRFYALAVAADLFGKVLTLRNWGRRGAGGRLREDLYSDFPTALASLERIAGKKRRRGYSGKADGLFMIAIQRGGN